MDTTGYNGWTNYETWAVALWLDNNQASYEYCREQTREALTATWDAETGIYLAGALRILADQLETEHAEANPLETEAAASVYTDLLRAALGNVDWHEVAEHYIDQDTIDEVTEGQNA